VRQLPARALQTAAAAGACCVKAASALGGVRPWDESAARIDAGWARLPLDRARLVVGIGAASTKVTPAPHHEAYVAYEADG